MSAVTEAYKAWQEGFENKDSSQVGEFMTDDFEFISTIRTMNKQQTLDWIAAGGNPTSVDDLEVLYENDEVAVITHSAKSFNPQNTGQVMACAKKRAGKFSQWRLVRAVISD